MNLLIQHIIVQDQDGQTTTIWFIYFVTLLNICILYLFYLSVNNWQSWDQEGGNYWVCETEVTVGENRW